MFIGVHPWLNFPMNITSLNPDTDIGASAWLVEIDDHRILLDAGMHPKREGREGLPMFKAAKNSTSTRLRFRIATTITSAGCRWRAGISPRRTC